MYLDFFKIKSIKILSNIRGGNMEELEKKELRKKYLDLILSLSENKYYKDFIKFIFIENKFINDVDFNDIKDAIKWSEEEHKIIPPFVKSKYYTFGFDEYGYDYIIFGIDPKNCFNKLKHCSIMIYFRDIKKREYENAKKLLKRIFNRKDNFSKTWFKEASCCWCGEYGIFGV